MLPDKQTLRRRFLAERAAQAAQIRQEISRQIAERLLQSTFYRRAGCVFCYVSTREEIDTVPLLARMLTDGKVLCVPKCGAVSYTHLQAHLWDNAHWHTDGRKRLTRREHRPADRICGGKRTGRWQPQRKTVCGRRERTIDLPDRAAPSVQGLSLIHISAFFFMLLMVVIHSLVLGIHVKRTL